MRAPVVAAWLALATMHCQAAVYAHVDPVSGMTVLSNVPPAQGVAGAARATAASPAAPAAFPRVSSGRQKLMDDRRREMLETELGGEQQALAAATGGRAAADIVQRHVANVEALKRELAGVR